MESCFKYQGRDTDCPSKCDNGGNWRTAHVCRCARPVECGGTLAGWLNCIKSGAITMGIRVYSDFGHYKSGIYCWNGEGEVQAAHAFKCYGYSTNPKPHFLCVNSWGEGWGEKGYFKVGTDPKCGLPYGPNGNVQICESFA